MLCQSNIVAELTTQENQTEDIYVETAYLNTIESTDNNIYRRSQLESKGKEVSFKDETGAEATL